MTRAEILRTALDTLDGKIGPTLTDARALSAFRCLRNVLAFLFAEESARKDRIGDGTADDRIDVAWGYFDAGYRSQDAAFDDLLAGRADLSRVRNLLQREHLAIGSIVEAITTPPARRDVITSPVASALDIATLEAKLRSELGNEKLQVKGFTPFADGRSKLTGLLKLEGAAAWGREVVLRMDLAVSATRGPSVSVEYDLLRILCKRGLIVPEPLFYEGDADVLGAPFILMGKVRGSAASGLMGPPYSSEVARALAGELARLHRVPIDEVGATLPSAFPPSANDLADELRLFDESWRTHDPEPSLAMRFALHWLRENSALATWGTPSVTHRDPLFHNVMADGDEMTALLDWEFVRIGYPAEDLGWVRSAVEEAMPWSDFMTAYTESGGPQIPDAVIDFYSVWGAVRLGMMFTYSNWLASTGKVSSIDYSSAALRECQINRLWLARQVARVA